MALKDPKLASNKKLIAIGALNPLSNNTREARFNCYIGSGISN
jgi:hypothetical protein